MPLRPPSPAALTLVVLTATLAACSGPASGQEPGERRELETDRDSFTFATTTAGAGLSILEASYSFIDNRSGPEAHSVPEVLLRHGVWERVELRLGFNYEGGGPGTVSGSEFGGEDVIAEDESRVLYGTKVETSEQAGWMPQSACIVQGFTPTSGPTTASTMMVGEAFGWTFANGWTWNTSIRYGTGSEKLDAFNQWAPSTVLKIPVGDRWNVHAEYFGIFSSGKEEPVDLQLASMGGHVLVTEDFEIGLRVGWGINDSSPDCFSNVGVGVRY